MATDVTGTIIAQSRYTPFGTERVVASALPTDFGARMYSSVIGRFISPIRWGQEDTILKCCIDLRLASTTPSSIATLAATRRLQILCSR